MLLLISVSASFTSSSLNTISNVKYIQNFEHKLERKEKVIAQTQAGGQKYS